jgi:hypothetical protein
VATKDPGPALHEGFRLTYPSGTVVMAFYAGGRAPWKGPGDAPHGDRRGGRGAVMKGIHAALQGRLGADVELRPFSEEGA